jgi:AraC-like DNA-binding protein
MIKQTHPKTYLYRRIVDAKLFIDSHYLDNIDITNIAGEACFSKFHFLRLFRQTYCITPHQYLTTLRIAKAKELLRNNTSITETCYSLGFASLSSFNKLFKRHVKVLPSAYAAYNKELRIDIKKHPLNHVPMCFIEYMGWDK